MRIIYEEMSSWTPLTMYDNEENILDQINIKQMCSDFYYEDLKFRERSKMLSSSLDILLKVSETTSPLRNAAYTMLR